METLFNILFSISAESEKKIARIVFILYMFIAHIIISFFFAQKLGYRYDGTDLTFVNTLRFLESGQILIPLTIFVFVVILTKYLPKYATSLLAFILHQFFQFKKREKMIGFMKDLGIITKENTKGKYSEFVFEFKHQLETKLVSSLDNVSSFLTASFLLLNLVEIKYFDGTYFFNLIDKLIWIAVIYWGLNLVMVKYIDLVIDKFCDYLLFETNN